MTLLIAGAATAQVTATQTSEVIKFEVISVDGNTLVVRDETGAREVTVPDDFRFTVDGKSMSVHELTPGMKGTAQVTTTTVIRPVYVTTIKTGTVVKRVRDTVYVKTEDGSTRKFTKSELEQRGIQVIMDGKPVRLADLKGGDKLTATIVTSAPPEVLTAKDVQAVLDMPEPTAAEVAAAEPAPAPAAASAEAPAAVAAEPAAAEAAPATEDLPVVAAPEEPAKAEEKPNRTLLWVGLVVIILVGVFLLMRRKKTAA
jgi:LPXTG-motif cell wall-anchored protein